MTEPKDTPLDDAVKAIAAERLARAERVRQRFEAMLAEERVDVAINATMLGPNTYMFQIAFIPKE
jgi:hypothetical protein